MTTQEQIKALAELDGYVCIDVSPPLRYLTPTGEPAFAYILGDSGWFWTSDTPSYLASYDAIIPLIQKQDIQTRTKMVQQLELGFFDELYWWHASNVFVQTPAQLSEALLRATGKWKDA